MSLDPKIKGSQDIFLAQSSNYPTNSAFKQSSSSTDLSTIFINSRTVASAETVAGMQHKISFGFKDKTLQSTSNLANSIKIVSNGSLGKSSLSSYDSDNSVANVLDRASIDGIKQSLSEKMPARANELFSLHNLDKTNTSMSASLIDSKQKIDRDKIIVIRGEYAFVPAGTKIPPDGIKYDLDGKEHIIPPENIHVLSKEEFYAFTREAMDQLQNEALKNNKPDEKPVEKQQLTQTHSEASETHPDKDNVILEKMLERKEEMAAQDQIITKKIAQRNRTRIESAKEKQISHRRKKEEKLQAYEKAQVTKSRIAS